MSKIETAFSAIKMKLSISSATAALTIAAVFFGFANSTAEVRSQPVTPLTSEGGRVKFIPPEASNDSNSDSEKDRPVTRTPGGGRDNCPAVAVPLTALIPDRNPVLTVAENPTFWFYIPYQSNTVFSGEFVLQNASGDDLYRLPFSLQETPGIVKLQPPSPPPKGLEINQSYHWFVKISCNAKKSHYVFIEGWVKRIQASPTLQSQLAADKQRQYAAYAANGIWYDALTNLAELRLSDPENQAFQADWAELLKDVGLESISQKPLVKCCTFDR